MVKNAGGNKSKGFARKDFIKKESGLRTSGDPAEVYAQVVKVLGGAMCHVSTLEDATLLCHIRGKFRGRGKRDNILAPGTWVLVGLREWEKEPIEKKLANCDLLEVYSEGDKTKLRNSVTSVNWSRFVVNDSKSIGMTDKTEADDVSFIDEKTQEFLNVLDSHMALVQAGKTNIITTADGETVDVEDI
jgi:translation initiation factor IF-1